MCRESEGLRSEVKKGWQDKWKKKVKWNGERFFRAGKGFIILEISLGMW